MPERLHPGVYVEEVPSEVRPIEGVSTSTAAFIGIAEKGPIDEAIFMTNWTAFLTKFGSFINESDLAYAVYHFFLNGGKKCYVVRVNHGTAYTAFVMLQNDQRNDTLKVEAASPGTWGNRLKVSILPGTVDPEREFSIKVWEMKEMVENFPDLSMVDGDDNYVEKVINRASNYIKVKDQGLSDRAVYRGTVDLSTPINLLNVRNINLQIDDYGPYKIDCSAKADDKSKVSRQKIIDAINEQFSNLVGGDVAFAVDKYIELRSPTTGSESQIIFIQPDTADATEDIFGVIEYSWQVIPSAGGEIIAEVRGIADLVTSFPSLPTTDLIITVGTTEDTIDLTGVDNLGALISAINGVFLGLASSNGTHLWLRASEDIKFDKSNLTDAIFGSDIYSIVEHGSVGTAAEFVGAQNLGGGWSLPAAGTLRLKIDKYLAMDIKLDAGIDLNGVIETINTQYKEKTGLRRNIAKKGTGDTLIITSPSKRTESRVVVSYSGDSDAGVTLFGDKISSYTGAYEFIAEDYKVLPARVTGKDISSVTFNSPKSHIRFSINDSPSKDVDFGIGTLTSLNIAVKINAQFPNIAWIDYSESGKEKLVLESPTRGTDSRIYFSIPLTNLVHDPSLNALDLLFDPSVISGLDTVATPDYIKTVLPPKNRPQLTIVGDIDTPKSLTGGTQDHEGVTDDDVLGQSGVTGIKALDVKDDVSLICIPGKFGDTTPKGIMEGGMAYCEQRSLQDCFFIADMPKDKITPTDAKTFVKDELAKKSDYGAIYYPWIKVTDPIGTSENVKEIPPSGLVAGMYARIDSARGVWKAPAGTESNISGALALGYKTTDTEQDILNPFGINCVRQFPGSGIVIWGSRTLGLKSKPEWKYIPVRRMAIFLRVSIYNGIQWVVFEPNDEDLWASLRLNIGAFMMRLFRQAAFQGDTPSKAFFVKCDDATTTQADIDAGVVNILVGFAPLKPAEFVVLKLSQKAGQTAV